MKVTIELPTGQNPELLKGYCIVHQIENWFRELVYLELKAHFPLNWWEIACKELDRSKVRGITAERSLKADKAHPHMSTPETDPLWFLSFDSLLRIIFDQKLWPIFHPYLTTKQILRAKLEEIRPIRNRIAHCRSLHADDLDRLEAFVRDVDQGFWKFCTSYNNSRPIIAELKNDPVYKSFASRECITYAQVASGTWARIGMHQCTNLCLMVDYIVRPSASRGNRSKITMWKGAAYDVTFFKRGQHSYLDYRKILRTTQPVHDKALHIFLDAFQKTLRVTFPASIKTGDLIPAIERFHEACANCTSFECLRASTTGTPAVESLENYEANMRPFEQIASEWPHYVIPPTHPFSFLCPDMPCKFFQRV